MPITPNPDQFTEYAQSDTVVIACVPAPAFETTCD